MTKKVQRKLKLKKFNPEVARVDYLKYKKKGTRGKEILEGEKRWADVPFISPQTEGCGSLVSLVRALALLPVALIPLW